MTRTDVEARVRQGASPGTSSERLRQLARDPDVTVRVSLALNPALPPQIGAMLAVDEDERVRLIMDRKRVTLPVDLPPGQSATARQQTVASLTAIVAQAALKVRTSIAQAVRDMPDGPRETVVHLAHDPEPEISEPVIQASPMLTQADLLGLIASAPVPGTIAAVARRPRIDEAVADAVVGSADAAAITALLCNHSARIREATLDALAAQSEDQAQWREPLIRRPRLPVAAQRMLAEIVTGHLAGALAGRPDLDAKVGQQLRRTVVRPPSGPAADMPPQAALAHAQALSQNGGLRDEALLQAMRAGAPVLATAMFAVRARAPVWLVERLFRDRDAAAVVALAWRGGMAMQTAIVVQAALARLPPEMILRGGPGGGFPSSEADMQRRLAALDLTDAAPRRWTPRRLQQSD